MTSLYRDTTDYVATRIADTGAAVSAIFAGATWVAELSAALQIIATTVAIIAGICAALYHIEQTKAIKRNRKDDEDSK